MHKKCKKCGKKLDVGAKGDFCKKHSDFNKKRRTRYIQEWLIGKVLPTKSRPRVWVRNHILSEQNNKCAVCRLENIWNNKELIFILDHIDGNSDNNDRENLRLVCPNCDSQLPTYKARNKGNGRFYRRERYAAGKSY